MPDWLRWCYRVELAVVVVVLFGSGLYGAFALAHWLDARIGGALGHVVAFLVATTLLIAQCFLAARIAIAFRAHEERVAAQARRFALRKSLNELCADARLSRWAPLARRWQRVDRDEIEQWEHRYQALLAHPRRKVFAQAALAGRFMTDEEIDYALDPYLRLTCTHLRALEGALRATGVAISPAGPRAVRVGGTLDGPRLIAEFALPECVDWFAPPFHPHEQDTGRLRCAQCDSAIYNGMGEPCSPTL